MIMAMMAKMDICIEVDSIYSLRTKAIYGQGSIAVRAYDSCAEGLCSEHDSRP